MARIPAVSKEFLYVGDIAAFDASAPDAAVDPTSLTVALAFVIVGVVPAEDDWQAGAWEDASTVRILLGPGGGVELERGYYAVWLRVTGATEQPERIIGSLQVT